MQNLNWDDLRLLTVVSRHASLLDAGKALGVATTTVSRRIAALEACVGSQLIRRTHAGTVLTTAGARLLETIEPLIMALEAALRGVAGADSQVAGAIKLSVVEGLVPLTLEAIQSFRELHPGVVFELDASNRNLDISNNEADLALRTLKPKSEGLVVRRVASIHFGVYMSSLRTVARDTANASALLARSEAVLLGGELLGLRETNWLRQQVRAVSLQTETLGSLIDAVRRGIGVGVIPDELVHADAGLRRLCDCAAVPQKTLWLVMNQRTAKTSRRLRLFADHITEHLRRTSGAGK